MAERPNYTGSGRTLMTAPIRAAAPNPERDADRGTGQGLEAFGRGMASLGQSVYQVGQFKEQEKRRAEAVERERQNNNRQIALNLLDSRLLSKKRELAQNQEYVMSDDKGRAPVLEQQEKEIREELDTLYGDLGLDANDPWLKAAVDERINRAVVPEIAAGADIRFQRVVATDYAGFVNRIVETVPAQDSFASLKGLYVEKKDEIAGLPDSRQSPESRQRLLSVLEGGMKAQADWLATTGAISEQEIEQGLKDGMWNGTEAAALRSRLASATQRNIAARTEEVNTLLNDARSGKAIPPWKDFFSSPAIQQQIAYHTSRGEIEQAKAVVRKTALAADVNKFTSPLVSAKGLPEGFTFPMIVGLRDKLSTLAGQIDFFGSRIKIENAGDFTVEELNQASQPLIAMAGQIEKMQAEGTPNRLFENHPKLVDYAKRNPTFMQSASGLRDYAVLMGELQSAAGIDRDSQNRTPWELTRNLMESGKKPGEWPAVVATLAEADANGAIVHELLPSLPTEFVRQNYELTTSLMLAAGMAGLPKTDVNRQYAQEAVKNLSLVAAARQRGDIDAIEKQHPGVRNAALTALVRFGGHDNVFDSGLADNAGSGLNADFDTDLSTSLQSFTNLQNAFLNTPGMAKVSGALQDTMLDQILFHGFQGKPIEKGGNPNLARGLQQALRPLLSTWTVVPSNGSDAPLAQMRLTAVPVWGENLDWFGQMGSSTFLRGLAQQGTDEVRTIEGLLAYTRPLLGAGGMSQGQARYQREWLGNLGLIEGDKVPQRNLAWLAEVGRSWNEFFTQSSFLINTLPGASFNDSLMPYQSSNRYNPLLGGILKKELPEMLPNYEEMGVEVKTRDEFGGVRTEIIPLDENRTRGTPWEEVMRGVYEATVGIKGASIADRNQLLLNDHRYRDVRLNSKDGSWNVFITQGLVKSGFGGDEGDAFGTGARVVHRVQGEWQPVSFPRAFVKDTQSTTERTIPRAKTILSGLMFPTDAVKEATVAKAKEMAAAAGEGNYEKYLAPAFLRASGSETTLEYESLARRWKKAKTNGQ